MSDEPKRLLIQLQLSNYDKHGKYILEADSGWNMMINRAMIMLDMNKNLTIDMLVPKISQTKTKPTSIVGKYKNFDRVNFICHKLPNHAFKTRYHFNFQEEALALKNNYYTHVYINDPMLFRNYKALFNCEFKYNPFFMTHSHFIDNPEAPKVPKEITYWYGQIEAALRSDFNFWQCYSAYKIFLKSMGNFYHQDYVKFVKGKSMPWDDGYSTQEINIPIDYEKLRFKLPEDKVIIFVPNRVSYEFDYTNTCKFLFDWANKLWEMRKDFVVVFGNPNQKVLNAEIIKKCKPAINVVPNTFTRNEYRYVAKMSHINVGLYDNDSYGGTAWRELIDAGCLPLSPDVYEYKKFFDKTKYPFKVKPDFSDIVERLDELVEYAKCNNKKKNFGLKKCVLKECAVENTTEKCMKIVGLI